jgi:arylsulfatase
MGRPNILILYTDQQRWDALGANGNPDIQTPNLDRLAAEGTNFTRFFVQNPVCMPSRISFLTGQYPSSLKITHMGVPVPEDTLTLPHMLSPYGYTCGNMGKLHFLPHADRYHNEPHPNYGFDTLINSDEPGCYDDAYRAWVRCRAPEALDAISVGLPPTRERWESTMRFDSGIAHPEREKRGARAFPADEGLTHTAFVADQTARFIEQNRTHPFLAIAGFYSPHAPWVAPQRFLDLYDPSRLALPHIPEGWTPPHGRRQIPEEEIRSVRQGYYAMVSEVDHHVGQLLDCLERQGIADNTVVIFTSDHGEYLGDHQNYGKGAPGHDCVSRVPCLIRWPAGAAGSGTANGITEAVDVVPTLLEAAGIPLSDCIQGQSLLPALQGDHEHVKESALLETDQLKTLRTDRYRYVFEKNGRESLYDLEIDPGGYFDVAEDPAYSETVSEHRAMLLEKCLDAERPMLRRWTY